MNNILVTGADGFIGTNLIKKLLEIKEVNILRYTRNNTLFELKELISQCNFIYHIAGEVRPKSSNEAFQSSNVDLTENIIKTCEDMGKNIPILYLSSIHAKLQKNEYGKSKRTSELIIEKYAKKHEVICYIYRLPHVFGEGCKANYNSVISTWIYNSIKGLEINIFDRNIVMHYVYVQDIVNEFIKDLTLINEKLYREPTIIYETTLGEVVDYLEDFKENILNTSYEIDESQFKGKLFRTYKDYRNKI